MNINYGLINQALLHYEREGYEYIEVPWATEPEAQNATAPAWADKVVRSQPVSSGEQSYLHMIGLGKLRLGEYVCATPCFRPFDEGRSPLHQGQFYKIELIDFYFREFVQEATPHMMTSVRKMLRSAMYLFEELLQEEYQRIKPCIVDTQDEPRGECKTLYSCDIVTRQNIELGSYGVRTHPKFGTWIYGTGLALPRFSQAMQKEFK